MNERFWKIYKMSLKLTKYFSMLRPTRSIEVQLTESEHTDTITIPDIPEFFKGASLSINDDDVQYTRFENKLKELENLVNSIKKY